MNDPLRNNEKQRLATAVIFPVALCGLLFFASMGTSVRAGGGIGCGLGMPSEMWSYEDYEHGWPIPFGERHTEGGSNRFEFWSGELKYSWPAVLGDIAIVCGISYAIAVLLGACVSMRWQPIALTGFLTAALAAFLSLQLWLEPDRWKNEIERGERLEGAGYNVEWKYVGPVWWARLVSFPNDLSAKMFAVEAVSIDQPDPAEIDKTIATLIDVAPHLLMVSQVGLWDKSRIEIAGEDFGPRLRAEIAAAMTRESPEE